MNKDLQVKSMVNILAMTATVGILGASLGSHACGLEPSINGGFTISYPGSVQVAVAVADARRNRLLPPAQQDALPNEVRLQRMLADLGRLQSRLNKAKDGRLIATSLSFSLVLVGPGLWSHFYLTPGGVLANYHTEGPLDGQSVVITHHTALRAILSGNLSVDEATERGLIAFSGNNASMVSEAFQIGVRAQI